MEKVKLNKDQVVMFENHLGKEKMLLEKYMCKNIPTYIDNLTLEEVVQCILGNYELEKTPEYKLLEVFQTKNLSDFDRGFNRGIVRTLNELGIKIEGINA